MTLYLFETNSLRVVNALFTSIPESVGLLVFGIGLIVIAALIRSVLAKSEDVDSQNKAAKSER